MDPSLDLTLAGLVHDLNNVFQTILEAAELVGQDPNCAGVSAIIFRCVEQGQRIAASMAETDHGVAHLDRLVDHTTIFAADFTAAVKGPAVEFVRQIPPGTTVRMKANALERVLMNLFINATQAAKSVGRDRCCIVISATEQDGRVRVLIGDDGPGVPPDLFPSIFDAGFSTDGARSGLGLHIVHTLVTAAGGTVCSGNGTNSGAVFSIDLPAIRATSARED